MDELMQAVSTLGFPIVAYGAMFWYMVQQSNQHREEMNTVRASLDANTQAVIELRTLVRQLAGENDADQH